MALRKSQLYSALVKYVSDKATSQKGYLDTLSETDRNSTRRGQCGGLRHKQRHNTGVPAPEVIEKMVGPCGLEPQTSTVSIQKARMTAIDRSGHKCPTAISLTLEMTHHSGQQ
jgi:hypothetical protein